MAYFHCLIGGGSSGGGYELTVTCDADFAGTTITATDGVTTLTQTCPSASPYEVVFEIPNGGEWTISGIISGQTYSTSIDIPDSLELHSIPEGSTVLPTDDIQTWLACSGIFDKSYTTLNEVLADSVTLLALMSNDNAVDYLVRSTTWASGITTNSTAMTDIGANDYCANTLLSDSTWLNAICDSTYFESVLNVKIPVMTSDTTPSGECIGSAIDSSYPKWKSFDGNNSTASYPASGTTKDTYYLGYTFPSPVVVNKCKIYGSFSASYWADVAVYGGNNLNDLTKLSNVTRLTTTTSTDHYLIFANSNAYTYYVVKVEDTNAPYIHLKNNYAMAILELQFYGRADV